MRTIRVESDTILRETQALLRYDGFCRRTERLQCQRQQQNQADSTLPQRKSEVLVPRLTTYILQLHDYTILLPERYRQRTAHSRPCFSLGTLCVRSPRLPQH